MLKKTFTAFILLFIFTGAGIAQQSTGGSLEDIKETILNSNEITTIVFNYGSINEPNRLPNVADLVWRDLGYMFEFGPLAAAEVVNDDGDTLQIVSDTYIRLGQGDYSPEGIKWGFLPREGYANPDQNEIANSNNPDSWPASWSEWPGEYGDGVAPALNEVYYVMDDFSNAEFPYYPFDDDNTKRGLGVSVETRIYQYGGVLKNSLILKYKVTNESDKDLDKFYFGFHGDPHIGGASDYSDDYMRITPGEGVEGYSGSDNLVYNYDITKPDFGGKSAGYMTFKFLETLGNKGLTSAHGLAYSNYTNVPAQDDLMYSLLSSGNIGLPSAPGDWVTNMGSGPYELNAGESLEFKFVIFFSENYNEMLYDAVMINSHHNWPLVTAVADDNGGNDNLSIEFNDPGEKLSGTYTIDWNYTGSNTDAAVFLEYSDNGGITWEILAEDASVSGSYDLETTNMKDGANYLFRVIAYDTTAKHNYYYDLSSYLTIDNPDVNAKPELEIDSEPSGNIVYDSVIPFKWNMMDADDETLQYTLEYIDPYGDIHTLEDLSATTGKYQYDWNVTELPNSPGYKLRISVTDGNKDSVLTTRSFEIRNYEAVIGEYEFDRIAGEGTPFIRLEVPDPDNLTGDDYEVSFEGTTEDSLNITLTNVTSSTTLLENYKIGKDREGTITTPLTEGFKLRIRDREPAIDTLKTGFNSAYPENFYDVSLSLIGSGGVHSSEDWIVVFGDMNTTGDGMWTNPSDTTLDIDSDEIVAPFNIINTTYNQPANFRIAESIPAKKDNGQWDPGETIILQPQIDPGYTVNYDVIIYGRTNVEDEIILPSEGDTLSIVTYNQITPDDVFRFSTTGTWVTDVKDKPSIPEKFVLSQNYPNPFNPATTIGFILPEQANVKLKIYDILGREVRTLVNETMNAGTHTVEFNASGLASGMYIYRIEAGKYNAVKKMMLLK